jgi:hypothetical protein
MRYSEAMAARRAASFRLTTHALRLLAQAAKRAGVSQTAILEIAIRQLAKREGIG